MTDIVWKTFFLVSTPKDLKNKNVLGIPLNIPKKMEDLIAPKQKLTLEQLTEAIKIGKARYRKDQLQIGKKIEREHTPHFTLSTLIAMHHLDEFPRTYYTELVRAEKKMKIAELRKR